MLPAREEGTPTGSLGLICVWATNQIPHFADFAPLREENTSSSFLLSPSWGHDTRFPVSSGMEIVHSPDHLETLTGTKRGCP